MRIRWCAVLATVTVGGLALASPAHARDYAGQAWNVLPPGQSGSVPPAGGNSSDQLRMYDGLTPLFGRVGPGDITRLFKPNVFGIAHQGPTRLESTPRGRRVRIVRDRFGVPHITTKTRADLMYGAGWVSGEDRYAIMEFLRAPARLAALDVPDVRSSLGNLAGSGRRFIPSPAAEALIARQTQVLLSYGERGRRILRDIDEYVAGINANYGARGRTFAPWSRNDVYAMVALLAGVFGQGGGDEARNSELLDALRDRLGADRGWNAWDDLREQYDEETDVSVGGRFSYGRKIRQSGPGNAILDNGSLSRNPVGLPLGPVEDLVG